jgi:hypothetical protein
MTYSDTQTGVAFRNDKITVWDYMVKICRAHECWVYIKHAQQAKDGSKAYELLFYHYLGPNSVGSMATSAETK